MLKRGNCCFAGWGIEINNSRDVCNWTFEFVSGMIGPFWRPPGYCFNLSVVPKWSDFRVESGFIGRVEI
jgi:hypothetical protein